MKLLKSYLLLLFFTLIHVSLFAIEEGDFEFDRATFHPTYNIPWSAEFLVGNAPSSDVFLSWYTREYKLDPNIAWEEVKRDKDDVGMEHIRFQQTFNGRVVQHGAMIIHSLDGIVSSFNGEIYMSFSETTPSTASPELSTYLSVYEDAIVTIEADQVYVQGEDGGMYLSDVYFVQSEQNSLLDKLFVSVNGAFVLRVEPQLIHGDAKGTANTYYIGVQDIITDSLSSSSFRLRENARPIRTYKQALGRDFTDTDNYWNNTGEKIAGDVHYASQLLHTFFKDKFNWDSYANKGDSIPSVLNLNAGGNAYWNLAGNYATFLCKASASVGPCAAVDVVGHEFGHGVADENAGLVYSGESCMLHESLADINGTLLEWYHDSTVYTWLLGQKVWSGGIRNMRNPKAFNHPDTYKGQYFPKGCHGSGGVQNYWFYLMVKGDTGTNDNGHNYSLPGLGFEKAIAITYRAVFYYWTANTNFAQANTHALQAAKDIYGSCSDELRLTYEAWKAVGLEDTSFKVVDLTHSLIAPELVCSVIPDTIRLSCTGDPDRTVTWYFSNGDTATTRVVDYIAKNTGRHTFRLKTEICGITLWDTGYTNITYQPIAKFSFDRSKACNNGKDSVTATNQSINFDATKSLSHEWTVYPYGDFYKTEDLTLPILARYDLTFLLKSYYQDGCWDTVSHRLVVSDIPSVSFNVESACEGENIKLKNTTDTSQGRLEFTWYIDTAYAGTGFEPTLNLSVDGTYTLTVHVIDKNTNCSASKSSSFQVFNNPIPTFDVVNPCSDQNMTLIHSTQHTSLPNYYRWHLPTYKPFNKASIEIPTGSADFIPIAIEYKDQRGCYGITYDTIEIEKLSVGFSSQDEICLGDEVVATSNAQPATLALNWKAGDQSIGSDTILHLMPDAAGVMNLKLVARGSECVDSFDKMIVVHELPEPSFTIEKDICDGDTASVTNTSSDSTFVYMWLWGDGTSSGVDTTHHTYVNQTPGVTETYNLQLNAESAHGCVGKVAKSIVVNGNPNSAFTFSETAKQFVEFSQVTTNPLNNYAWDFGDGDTSSSIDPTHQYSAKGMYNADLSIVDENGCSEESAEIVEIGWGVSVKDVDKQGIFIIPNPTKGTFELVGLPNSRIESLIHDVNGKLVYEHSETAVNGKIDITTELSSGVYYLTVTSAVGQSTERLVIYK